MPAGWANPPRLTTSPPMRSTSAPFWETPFDIFAASLGRGKRARQALRSKLVWGRRLCCVDPHT